MIQEESCDAGGADQVAGAGNALNLTNLTGFSGGIAVVADQAGGGAVFGVEVGEVGVYALLDAGAGWRVGVVLGGRGGAGGYAGYGHLGGVGAVLAVVDTNSKTANRRGI